MDILKYFYEEPASLEVLTPALNPDARRQDGPTLSLEALLQAPRYYRAYWAGSNLAMDRVGLTAISQPDAFVQPLLHLFEHATWWCASSSQSIETLSHDARSEALRQPSHTGVLTIGLRMPQVEDVVAVASGARRETLPALRRLLDVCDVVAFPEPAHHGSDWSFFSKTPLRERFTAALQAHPYPGVRRFIVPFQRARSEQKFYFETWMLDHLPEYIEEV